MLRADPPLLIGSAGAHSRLQMCGVYGMPFIFSPPSFSALAGFNVLYVLFVRHGGLLFPGQWVLMYFIANWQKYSIKNKLAEKSVLLSYAYFYFGNFITVGSYLTALSIVNTDQLRS